MALTRPLIYLIGVGVADLITSEGTINVLNPQTAALQCIFIGANYQTSFVDCLDSDVSTFETIQVDETFFQIRLANNVYSNENICFEVNNEQVIIMKECNEQKVNQLFFLDESTLKNKNSETLCVTPWYDRLRNMPCQRLNSRYREKYYNFDDMNEALAIQQRLKTNLNTASETTNAAASDEIENLKLLRHGYLILKKRVNAVFSDNDMDLEGLYRWNHGARRFEHFLDLRKALYLSTENKQFELGMTGIGTPERMDPDNSEQTRLSKFYFQRYELVEFDFFDEKFCSSMLPCQNGGQCHDKPLGFSCACDPVSLQSGALCNQPTPCAEYPCKNNAACKNIFFTNGTASFECDCSTAPEDFSGPLCNDCPGGRGVEGDCIRFNSCLDSVEYCAFCNNEVDPRECLSCQGFRYVDSLSGNCAENQCVCNNGQEGECPIHNRSNCETCDEGYIHVISGEDKRCDSCGRNFEANAEQTECGPCLQNFASEAAGGTCQICSDNHVRPYGQEYCEPCPEHSHRPTPSGGCAMCPESHPRRFAEEAECQEVSCPVGQYANSATAWECQSCPQNFEPASDQRSCVACQFNYVSNGETSGTCQLCGVNYSRELDQENCVYCGDNFFRNFEGASCAPCTEPTPARSTFQTDCQSVNCPDGQFANSDTNWSCQQCSVNQESEADQRSCRNCEVNYYRSGTMTSCEICPDNHVRAGGNSECSECPNNQHRETDNGSCVACPSDQPARFQGEPNCRTVSCPAGQTASAPSWTCEVQESEYPIYYTPETSNSACYYPINHVDTRERGIAASHKYYATSSYANHLNCRFSINPAVSGSWRWKITFMDVEQHGSCNYDKFQRVGGGYYCNGRTSDAWHTETGQVDFTFTTDYSVTKGGFRFVFEPSP